MSCPPQRLASAISNGSAQARSQVKCARREFHRVQLRDLWRGIDAAQDLFGEFRTLFALRGVSCSLVRGGKGFYVPATCAARSDRPI